MQYKIGRDLARAICAKLPHATIGKTRWVRRSDVEHLFERAIQDGADLWDLMREHDAGSLRLWMKRAA